MISRSVRPHQMLLLVLLIATACHREPQGPEAGQSLAAGKGSFDPIPELAYVGVGYQPYVTVIHVPEMRELARIYVPASGVGTPALAPDGRMAYVPHGQPSGLSKVDLSNHAVLETLWVTEGSTPFDIALTPSGNRAFVTQFDGHTVAVIDTRRMELVDEIELTDASDYVNGIAAGPGGRYLFVASQVSARVHVIDVKTLEVVEVIETGLQSVNELAVTGDGALLFVTAVNEHVVVVIDAKNFTIEQMIPVPSGPVGVAASLNGREAYVACRAAHVVAVIDIESLEVVDEIPVQPRPQRIALNASGTRALTTHRGNGQITLLDLEKREVLATIYEDEKRPWNIPWGIAFASGPQRNTGGGQPGVPDRLYIAGGQQQTGIVGRPTFEPFKVYLYDAFYGPIPDAEITWEVSSGGGVLHPDLWPTDENGLTYAHLKLGAAPGVNTVTASVEGVDPVTFTVNALDGTGAFGFIRESSTTGWYTAYDLGLQGRGAWGDPRIPGLLEMDIWHGLATLRQPVQFSVAGRWGLRINMNNLPPNTEYTVVLARYGLIVNNLHDAEEMLLYGWPGEPDELVLLDENPGGYPTNHCLGNPDWQPVPPDANPFVIGYFVTDGEGFAQVRCNLDANGQWWSDNSTYIPAGAEDLAPFIPNSSDPSAGRFTLPSYNYLYIVEGEWSGVGSVPDDKVVMRWQVGIDLDLGGDPIPNGYAPLPIWPKYWP